MDAATETGAPPRPRVLSGRNAAIAGACSAALLAASIWLVHDWTIMTSSIVVAWAATTLFALVAGVRVWKRGAPGRRLALIGLAFGLMSVLALIAASAAFAMGIDPVAACGGG